MDNLIKGTSLTQGHSDRATRIFENLPSAETLEAAMIEMSRSGMQHEDVRRWARNVCLQFGIWSYVQPEFNWRFNRAASAASQGAAA